MFRDPTVSVAHPPLSKQLMRQILERGRHGEPESFAWLAQLEVRRKYRNCVQVGEIPSGPGREHASGDRNWSRTFRIEAQRVVGPVNAERRVDHRQKHL